MGCGRLGHRYTADMILVSLLLLCFLGGLAVALVPAQDLGRGLAPDRRAAAPAGMSGSRIAPRPRGQAIPT